MISYKDKGINLKHTGYHYSKLNKFENRNEKYNSDSLLSKSFSSNENEKEEIDSISHSSEDGYQNTVQTMFEKDEEPPKNSADLFLQNINILLEHLSTPSQDSYSDSKEEIINTVNLMKEKESLIYSLKTIQKKNKELEYQLQMSNGSFSKSENSSSNNQVEKIVKSLEARYKKYTEENKRLKIELMQRQTSSKYKVQKLLQNQIKEYEKVLMEIKENHRINKRSGRISQINNGDQL